MERIVVVSIERTNHRIGKLGFVFSLQFAVNRNFHFFCHHRVYAQHDVSLSRRDRDEGLVAASKNFESRQCVCVCVCVYC
jgi:hypothetical protein